MTLCAWGCGREATRSYSALQSCEQEPCWSETELFGRDYGAFVEKMQGEPGLTGSVRGRWWKQVRQVEATPPDPAEWVIFV